MGNDAGFSVDGRTLALPGREALTFDHAVEKVVAFDASLVVMLRIPPETRYTENIFGVSRETGAVMWQVPRTSSRYPTSYISMARIGDVVVAGKVEGLEVELDPMSGRILRKELRRF